MVYPTVVKFSVLPIYNTWSDILPESELNNEWVYPLVHLKYTKSPPTCERRTMTYKEYGSGDIVGVDYNLRRILRGDRACIVLQAVRIVRLFTTGVHIDV